MNTRSARNTGGGVSSGNGYNPSTGNVSGYGPVVPTGQYRAAQSGSFVGSSQGDPSAAFNNYINEQFPNGAPSISTPSMRFNGGGLTVNTTALNGGVGGPQRAPATNTYFDRARSDYQNQMDIYGSLAQSQYGPQYAALGQEDALIRQMMGLGEANLADTLAYLQGEKAFNQQEANLANQGTGITLDDINRRRGFAGRDLGISNEDINARRGFAGTSRDLERESIGTQRNRLNEGFNMDNILLNSDATPRGAFTSNLANTKRSSLSDRLTMDLADQDTRWKGNDLSYDQSMRGLLTEEQRARLGYDSSMSGLLTNEQMARLGGQKNQVGLARSNAGLDRQAQQANISHITDQFNNYMGLAKNDSERASIAYSIAGMLSEAGLPQSQIDAILGQTTGTGSANKNGRASQYTRGAR